MRGMISCGRCKFGRKRKKLMLFKKICNVISWVLIVFAVAVLLLLHGGRIFGIKPYTVLSGSMEPAYQTGAVVYVKSVPCEKLKKGDTVTYRTSSAVVTHRITKINSDDKTVITKGDANEIEDPAVSFDSIIGKVVFSIPYLGYVAVYISTLQGKLVIVSVVLFAVLLMSVSEYVMKKIHA